MPIRVKWTPIEKSLNKKLTKKFDSTVVNRQYFHKKTGLQIRKCEIVNIFQTHNWFVIVDAN